MNVSNTPGDGKALRFGEVLPLSAIVPAVLRRYERELSLEDGDPRYDGGIMAVLQESDASSTLALSADLP